MRSMWIYDIVVTIVVIILIGILMRVARIREDFIDVTNLGLEAGPEIDLTQIPEPQKIMKQMRDLLDRYDKPEVWNHATQMIDKDPGQLARLNLGIQN